MVSCCPPTGIVNDIVPVFCAKSKPPLPLIDSLTPWAEMFIEIDTSAVCAFIVCVAAFATTSWADAVLGSA